MTRLLGLNICTYCLTPSFLWNVSPQSSVILPINLLHQLSQDFLYSSVTSMTAQLWLVFFKQRHNMMYKNSASNKMYRISFTAIFFYLAVKIKASCMTNTRSCTSNPKKIKFLRILDFISHKVILQTCPAGTNPHEFSENKRTCNVTQVKWKYKFNLK